MDAQTVEQAHTLLRRGDVAGAIGRLQAALGATPPQPQSLKLLARLALREQQSALAGRALEQALAALPDDAEIHALLAAAARIAGDADALVTAARRALALDAGEPLAAALLTETLRDRLQLGEALAVADACLARRPQDWGTRLARADALQFAGEAESAAADARQTLEHAPSLQAITFACQSLLYLDEHAPDERARDERTSDERSQGGLVPDEIVRAQTYPSGPGAMPAAAVLARHCELASRVPALRLPPPTMSGWRPGQRPLRVALLSADLRRHPVGLFVEPLLAGWDRRRIAPICYSDGRPDATTARLRGLCPQWRDLHGLPDEAVARQLRDDGVDILLDLGGHTHGSRPRLLASRCVAVQLGWLGYLFDTGYASCDGVIGDAATLPDGTASARRPWRLPGSLLCLPPMQDAPQVTARPSAAAPTFGSFSHLAKLSPHTVALWARVLDAVPGSRLLLCALGLADASIRERIRARFTAAGLDPARLELRPPVLDPHAFLSQYGDVDIALDPLPFNGGTTTLQALWQGVPVITLPGERMAARTGLSILGTAGLGSGPGSLVARDADDYVRLAADLAADGDRRVRLRGSMRARLLDSGLADGRRFADGFATLLESAAATG
ncbi:hypothetical protein [Marilutibacter chinensis]|uniref:O-GlcNAc transferase C-terminal domain-containing protein n=1 Tax=Marilutibacter chinensis TaxID=2912247 RepID=A0ABS9HX07_9GAMM|nr:hypothetical protein [Lysobacter chinensis]MCF7222870.1 hypothetical protein [Lysobacter chinensis]